VSQHSSFGSWGKVCIDKWRAEPRPEPDSGNPTVRDRRGASGNVASGGNHSPTNWCAHLISIPTAARPGLWGSGEVTNRSTRISLQPSDGMLVDII
jgi:hypothetical protein